MKQKFIKKMVKRFLAGVMAVTMMFSAAPVVESTLVTAQASGWHDEIVTEGNVKTYYNERFNYWVSFPKYLKRYGSPVTNGDGATFKGNGIKMLVYGRYDIDGVIPESAEYTTCRTRYKDKNGKRTYYVTAYVIGSESTGIIKCKLSAKKSKLSALKKVKNIVVKSLKTNDQFQ